ncbi:14-3-3 protein homolog 2-like [Chenopodium quinoa]|uniref:14-3-3 protein homolog 2-like n=1 Tax=Chenopodium quinoa TaxID=63459 RepID=UPI000B78CC2F|nr:14-3-3 protein homolog 2-like [Chenopodium quinoa]
MDLSPLHEALFAGDDEIERGFPDEELECGSKRVKPGHPVDESEFDPNFLLFLKEYHPKFTPNMINAMKKLVKFNIDLTAEELNLLSTAYKKVIEPKRESWKLLSKTEQEEDTIYKDETYIKCIQDYRNIVESDLANICYNVITLIDDHLLPFASSTESSVFYLKMKADYYRYMAEIKTGDEKTLVAEESLKTYKEAMAIAGVQFSPIHPTRLGLALNFAVFNYEVLNSYQRAYQLAKNAFDDAMLELDDLGSKAYSKDIKVILNLLRDNFTLWKSENDR